MTKKLLDRIDVKSPCSESWDEMAGNDVVRFCSHCAKDVYDLSSMTRSRAEKLVKESGEQLCVRYMKDSNGQIVTARGRASHFRRQATIAAGVLATSLTLSTLTYSQGRPIKITRSPKTTVDQTGGEQHSKTSSAVVSGVVTDTAGAVIPGAIVTLLETVTKRTQSTATNAEGIYESRSVEPGQYEISAAFAGFKTLTLKEIEIDDFSHVLRNFALEPTDVTEVVGLLAAGGDLRAITDTVEPRVFNDIRPRQLLDLPLRGKFMTLGLIAIAPDEPGSKGREKKKKNKLPK